MGFPTTPILDNFNRADGGVGSNWTDGPDGGTYGGMNISGNVCVTASGDSWDYWNAATYGPDCEVYLTDPTIGGNSELGLRMTAIGTTGLDCYWMARETPLLFNIQRADNDVFTQLGADISQAFGVGDSFGLEAIGPVLTAFFKAAAGSWVPMTDGARTDTTYNTAGYLGLYMNSPFSTTDDFGGGTHVGPTLNVTRTGRAW